MTKSPPQLLWLSPADLEVDSDNADLYSLKKHQVERLKASMQRLGYRLDRPIVVHQLRRKGKYRVLDGWHRVRAAQELKLTAIPAVIEPSASKSANPPTVITGNIIVNQLSRRLPQGQRLMLVYMLSLLKSDPSEVAPVRVQRQAWWSLAMVSKTTWLQAKKCIAEALQIVAATYPELAPPDLLQRIIQDRTIFPDLYDLYHGKHTFAQWQNRTTTNSITPEVVQAHKILAALRSYLTYLADNTATEPQVRDRTRGLLELPAKNPVTTQDANAVISHFCQAVLDLLRCHGKRRTPEPHATTLPLFSSLPEDLRPHDHSETAA